MSLSIKQLEKAGKQYCRLQQRVNKLLMNKVMIDHYDHCYLFGKEITDHTSNDELKKIIEDVVILSDFNGYIGFYGDWNKSTKWRKIKDSKQ